MEESCRKGKRKMWGRGRTMKRRGTSEPLEASIDSLSSLSFLVG